MSGNRHQPQRRAGNGGSIVRAERHELRAGPLPDAEEYARYEQVLPGAANRILKMGELQQAHMHKREGRDQAIVILGQLTSLILGAAALGVAYYMIYSSKDGIEGVMYSIAAVVSVAIGGKIYLQSKKAKAKANDGH